MKKIFAVILALSLLLSLAACGGKSDEKTIKIGATPAPHAEILEVIKDALAAEGWTLQIVEFDDYILPNKALENGELDANYFQHVLYMEGFNEEYGTHLVSAGGIHYEPMGIYAGKIASLAALPDGAKIGVPNDTTNEARALLLLEQEGKVNLKDCTVGVIGVGNVGRRVVERLERMGCRVLLNDPPRAEREVEFAKRAASLEELLAIYPYQWFNLYPYWKE